MQGSHVCCNFAALNQVQTEKLQVMEALLEALSLHKAKSEVAREVAGAIWTICVSNGNYQHYSE